MSALTNWLKPKFKTSTLKFKNDKDSSNWLKPKFKNVVVYFNFLI